jgi:hypothetical protein
MGPRVIASRTDPLFREVKQASGSRRSPDAPILPANAEGPEPRHLMAQGLKQIVDELEEIGRVVDNCDAGHGWLGIVAVVLILLSRIDRGA